MTSTPGRWNSALVAAVLLATPAFASELSLTIRDGRVTLVADNVSVQEVLAEWARVGRVTIVNGERLNAPPLTLRLEDVPESDALASVLRTASGYVLAPRAEPVANASRFDRVLILPVSMPPPAGDPAAGQGPSPARRLPTFNRPVQPTVEEPGSEGADTEVPEEPPGNPCGATVTSEGETEGAPSASPSNPLYAPVPGQVVQPPQETRPVVPRIRLPGQQPSGQDVPRPPSD
jgi:hypothetical protein